MAEEYQEPLYLYLEKPEWAIPWLEGGKVPFYPASKYRAQERAGTQTPDELMIRDSYGVQAENLELFQRLFGDAGAMNVTMMNSTFVDEWGNERDIPFATVNTSPTELDAIVLCLSRARSKAVRDGLNKSIALKIVDLPALQNALSKHFGMPARPSNVVYTNGYDRSPFIKSMADCWQHEARFVFFVKDLVETWVELPAGVAEVIDLDIASMYEPDGRKFDHGGYDRQKASLEQDSIALTFGRPPPAPPAPGLATPLVPMKPERSSSSRTPTVDKWLNRSSNDEEG